MKKRLFFIMFMTLFCSIMFGQKPNWEAPNSGSFQGNMTVSAYFKIYGEEQFNENIEFAAFCGSELRGFGSKPVKVTLDGEDHYLSVLTVHGNTNETIKFKIWDPVLEEILGTLTEKNFYVNDVFGPIAMDFYQEHWDYTRDVNEVPESMTIISQVAIDDNVVIRKNLEVAAFHGEELRGIGRYDEIDNNMIYFTIYGNSDETEDITFQLYDHENGTLITESNYSKPFVNEGVYGDYYNPEIINFITAPYVAQIGDSKFTSLTKAVEAATAGNTIEVIADISNETVSVDKNLTITAENVNVTLTDVAINANGADELTVSNLSFTGNSWINSGTAAKLTVSGVTANVTPSNTSYTNSRSAFISLGNSEQQTLELTVTNCNIVANGGGDPILGWAAITKANLTGNTFGSAEAYQTNSDCVKFIAIANGAEFNITGNTIYSNYNGIVFGQNTTRDNAYTVNVSGNTFNGSADHIWLEVSGATTCHATVKATSTNTVNGKAFTANDIKALSSITTWTSYGGVDVVLDANGKVLGGTFKYINKDVIADGYTTSQNADGTYSIVKKLSGEIAYRAYVTDTETVEALSVDLANVYASSSLKVELYSGSELLVTTTYAKTDFPIDEATFTCFMVLSGTADEYWNTTIHAEELTVENLPTTIKLYVDGELTDTFDYALGAGTNVDETEDYKALDCVYDYKVAKVGDKEYWNIDNALKNWTAGSTLTLLNDVTLSDVITLKSTEHHILDLGTYTMTAASGKDAIQVDNQGRTSAGYALDINTDPTNPGGIVATGKAIVRTTGKSGVKDRPIIRFYNGVFDASYIVYHSGSNGTNCPQFYFYNGIFNGTIYTNRSLNIFYGGTFNGSLMMSVDSFAYTLISGGRFKQLSNLYMSALNSSKFTIGSAKGVYDREVYIDDEGYYVIAVSEPVEGIEAEVVKNPGTDDYLKYSKVGVEGFLNYTDVKLALNGNETGTITLNVDELDMTDSEFKGTLVIKDELTVTFAEGTTPAWTVTTSVEDKEVFYTEVIKNGVVTRTYSVMLPVAQIGETKYESLQAAFEVVTEGQTVEMLSNVVEEFAINNTANVTFDMKGFTLTGSIKPSTANLTVKNGTINSVNLEYSAIEINYGSLTLNDDVKITSKRHGIRIDGGVTVTINGGEYRSGTESGTRHALNVSGAANVTIKNGTFVGPKGTTADSGAAVNVQSGATVTIEGGNFSGGKANTLASTGTLTLTGGTYDQDVTAYCATDYICREQAEGVYVVVEGPKARFDGYAAYVGDTDSRENISVDFYDVIAYESIVVKIYSGSTLLSTTTLRTTDRDDNTPIERPIIKDSYTANVVVSGNLSGSWDTEWYVAPSVAYIPNKFEVYCDNVLCDTFEGWTDENINDYSALDGVYKAASITNANGTTYFASLQAAIAAAQANETITMLVDVTLTETVTIEKAITLDLNGKTVTGADGAIVFNVKAATTIKNGSIKGNKSGTSSGLIDIYANLNLNGVTIETTEYNALRFKAGECTALLENCNVTGAFKGYGGSVWEIKSGTYKASSTSISEQLNGTASVSGGTFHYEIDEVDCAPGYVVKDNGDGTWTVEYAPAAFVDANNNGTFDSGEAVYGNLDQVFANHKEGNVYVVLTGNIVANNRVDTDADAHYYITTNAAYGVKMNFLYADPEDPQPYNYIWNMDIAANVTLDVKYLTVWGKFNLAGKVDVLYPFFVGATATIEEGAIFNQSVEGVGSEAIQIKEGAVLTVEGTVNANIINLYTDNGTPKLIIDGENAKVKTSSVNMWKGTTLLTVKNGAELEGKVSLGTITSTVEGPQGLNVVSSLDGYGVNYYNGVYSLVQIVTQSQTLSAGWNWFSSYIDINGEDGLVRLQNALGTNGVQIKDNDYFTNYTGKEEQPWFGTLESTSVEKMYMISMKEDHVLQIEGNIVDPAQNAITLQHGWNWIGYQLNQELDVNDALANIEPQHGDRIKSHLGFSQYYNNDSFEGWWGTLNNMTPGVGYMYYNAGDATTLTYSYPAEGSKSELRANITAENNYWVPASSQYANNMNIIAMLDVKGSDYEVAAFVGGEVRGSARPIYVEPLDSYILFLTIYGEDIEEMTFKCYDLITGETYNLSDRINYSNDAIIGSVTDPYMFNCGILGVDEMSSNSINIYPNPTTTGREINLEATCDTVEVFNALGVKIAEYQNVDTIDAIETAGIYVIRITNNSNVQNCRLVVK